MPGIQEAKILGILLLVAVGLFGVIWAIGAYEDVWPAGAICFVASLLFVLLVGSSLRTTYGAGSSGNSDDRKPEEEELVQEREDDEEWEDDDVADYERPWFLNKLFLACFFAVLTLVAVLYFSLYEKHPLFWTSPVVGFVSFYWGGGRSY